jgi:hypothetical protein
MEMMIVVDTGFLWFIFAFFRTFHFLVAVMMMVVAVVMVFRT